jgi:hypothetical protein
MAETIGDRDEDFQAALQSAGYSADTIVLAELTPQIQLAWADARVSRRERDVIFETAVHRGVRPYSRAQIQLARWLEHRPSDHLFRVSREAMRRMLRRLPGHLQANVRRSLLRECADVARASGGFLGWRCVSRDEQQLLDFLASELDPGDPPTAGSKDGGPSALAVSAGTTIRG